MFTTTILAIIGCVAFFLIAAVLVIVTSPSEEQLRARQQADADRIRREIAHAQRQHKPRKHLFKQLVEARRKELAQ